MTSRDLLLDHLETGPADPAVVARALAWLLRSDYRREEEAIRAREAQEVLARELRELRTSTSTEELRAARAQISQLRGEAEAIRARFGDLEGRVSRIRMLVAGIGAAAGAIAWEIFRHV